MIFPLICLILALDDSEKKALRLEDLRMAAHLISEGYSVTHPEYPFLRNEKIKVNGEQNNAELKKEDARMLRHLKIEGFTVN